MCKIILVWRLWEALKYTGMDEGSFKMNPEDKNKSGNWKRSDLLKQSLVSFFRDDEKSSAPIKNGISIRPL
jgi:hypothetical protein